MDYGIKHPLRMKRNYILMPWFEKNRRGSRILMAVFSSIFYFLNQHSLLSIPLILLLFHGLSLLLLRRTRNPVWYGMSILGFVAGMVNIFAASWLNALFLNAFGTYGTAMVTNAEETNSQINEQSVWNYDVVMRTADGRDVKTGFDTLSLTLYPLSNALNVPPTGERFVVKYVPGFERNIVVMRDESAFGRRLLVRAAREPIDKARNQLKASPQNPAFKAEYREALSTFLNDYGVSAPEPMVRQYRRELDALKAQ